MSSEHNDDFFKSKKFTEELVASSKTNERMAKMMRSLKQENERLRTELLSKKTKGTGESDGYKKKFEALVKINHGWKQDYERLAMRCEMLNDEKRQLEYDKKDLGEFIETLEKRRVFLESEIKRLAAIVDAHGRIRFILPCHPVDEICQQQQQQQQRRVVLPRNGYGVPLIYGGEMKSGYPEEL